MKLIVSYNIGDEECCADVYTPIEFDGVDEAKYEFEMKLIEKLKEDRPWAESFWIGGAHFDVTNHTYLDRDKKKYCISMPEIEELNEWFDRRMNEETLYCPRRLR